MNYDVFISYSRKDSTIVDEFVRLIEDEGFRVWIDRDGVESGDAFKRAIVRAIKESKIVLFFSSKFSNASSWTAKEISISVHHGKPIIPIKIDKAVYNEEVEFDLVTLDYIDYTDSATRNAMKAKLLRTLRSKLPERWKEICESKRATAEEPRNEMGRIPEKNNRETEAVVEKPEPERINKSKAPKAYENTKKPVINLVLSVIVTFLFWSVTFLFWSLGFLFWPVGIVAIINAYNAKKLWQEGRYSEAEEASNKAKKWMIIAAIIGVGIVLLGLLC